MQNCVCLSMKFYSHAVLSELINLNFVCSCECARADNMPTSSKWYCYALCVCRQEVSQYLSQKVDREKLMLAARDAKRAAKEEALRQKEQAR